MSEGRRSRSRIDHREPPRGYVTPPGWTVRHAGWSLVAAFQTLRQMPGGIGPRGVRSNWPSSSSWDSLRDLLEAVVVARHPDETAQKERPSAEAINRMTKALQWTSDYLIDGSDDAAERSALVQATAKALAYGLEMRAIAERRHVPTMQLVTQYHSGLNAIAVRLQADHVPVWELDR